MYYIYTIYIYYTQIYSEKMHKPDKQMYLINPPFMYNQKM